jgi:23S rRNA pseudouridine1911/1915/1917 synthase
VAERRASHVVPREAAGQRLDAWLAELSPELSRSRLKSLIDEGRVLVDGQPSRASRKIAGGELVVVDPPAASASALLAQELPLDVLYQDDRLIVVNKPAGLVVHPGAGNPSGTLANALRFLVPTAVVGGEERPGIVHRLDKDTSGVMVCALDDEAHRLLSAAFKAREVDKRYLAFCIGRPRKEDFELITGHRRHDRERRRFTTKLAPPEEEGRGLRRAASRYRLLRSLDGVAELEVELFTGRTHQIRAQLADIGHPLVKDELYGGGNADKRVAPGIVREAVTQLKRHGLHAWTLAFEHPGTKQRLRFEAPLPEDLARLEAALLGTPHEPAPANEE